MPERFLPAPRYSVKRMVLNGIVVAAYVTAGVVSFTCVALVLLAVSFKFAIFLASF